MAAPRKYPDELREGAIRMAVDARRGPDILTLVLHANGIYPSWSPNSQP